MRAPIVSGSEIVHQNPWYRVRRDILTWPNGNPGQYFVTEFKGASCVICVRDGEILTVKQYRHTIERVTIELPMGGMRTDDPLQTAKDELREETGYTAKQWKKIGFMYGLKGACRMPFHIYTASELEAGPTKLDESEVDLQAEWLPVQSWRSLIREGKIEDAESMAAWTLYREYAHL